MNEREDKANIKETASSEGNARPKRVQNSQDRPKKAKNLEGTEIPRKKRRQRPEGQTGERRQRSEGQTGERRQRSEGQTGERRQRPEGQTSQRRSRPKAEAATQKVSKPKSEMKSKAKPRNVVQNEEPMKRKKKNPIMKILFVFFLFIIIAAGAVAALYWTRYGPGQERADINEYYGIESEDQLAIILDNEILEEKGRMIDGIPYVSYATLRDSINSRFYLDINENDLLYTLPQEVIKITQGSSEYSTLEGTQSEAYAITQIEGNDVYVALEFVQKYTNIDFEMFENPHRISIITQWGDVSVAEVKENTQVRRLAGIKSPILTEINKQEQVVTIEDEGDWKKVRTDDGFIGYVRQNALQPEVIQNRSREFEEQVFTNISRDFTINLGWHQVTSQAANQSISEVLERSPGMNVISPTWFSVADNDGNMNSLISKEYVEAAQRANVEVWALVENFNPNVDSHALLSNASSRENMANQLVEAVLEAGIEGINLDFESLRAETGEHYVQFIREMSVLCRAHGIVLSIDNYVPKYTGFYNRKEQGIVADYVIIMGYDEHYSGSSEAGPVASFGYVEEGIVATLAEVPAEKVINGVPFYTRVWSEVPKTEAELAEQAGTEAAQYTMKVSSTAMGMVQALGIVEEAGVEVQWDDVAKLDYATWEEDGTTYRVWLENVRSLEPRLQLMQQYELAGVAAWKIGFETPDIWELISQYTD